MRKIPFYIIGALFLAAVVGFLACYYGGYSPYAVKALAPVEKVATTPVVTPPPAPPASPVCVDKKHTVLRGESLWRIAGQEYGGRNYMWQLIAEKNNVEGPKFVIQPDQVLTIPMVLCDLGQLPVKAKVVAPVQTRKVAKVVSAPAKVVAKTEPLVRSVVVDKAEAPKAPIAQSTSVPTPAPASAPTTPAPVAQPAPVAPVEVKVEAPKTEVKVEQPVSVVVMPPQVSVTSTPLPALPVSRSTDIPFLRTASWSAWNSTIRAPIEPDNTVNYFHADLGFNLAQFGKGVNLTPYVAVNTANDTQGLPWDNKLQVELGMKISKIFGNGIVDLGGAYGIENRQGGESRSGFFAYTSGWFAHDTPTRSSRNSLFSSTPGSAWWKVGNFSPFEHNNILAVGHAEQGFTLAKVKSISLIPEAWARASFDTKNYIWNNRYIYGGGLKVGVPWNTGILSITGGYECVKTHDSHGRPIGNTVCGPKVDFDIWTGGRFKTGGR